ncbi:hypothetical protein K2P56_05010 [Patescibacteria group bacterium]|nr:hypothetical protein [Patescibacteria group bacterium]
MIHGFGEMLRRPYVFITTIAALILVVFALNRWSTPPVIVHMTEEGFVPAAIEISQGATVRFQNIDTTPHWPAANIHPTHARYPGSDARKCGTFEQPLLFDSCKGIAPGEHYDFTFEKSGLWGLHDHLYPQFFGEIKVAAVSEYQQSLTRALYQFALQAPRKTLHFILTLPENTAATLGINLGVPVPAPLYGPYTVANLSVDKDYEKMSFLSIASNDLEVSRMIAHLGVKKTLEKMFKESKSQNNAQCHLAAHTIGRNAFNLYGVSALGECNLSCHAGCYHGAMEVLGAQERPEELFSQLVQLCGSYDTVFARYQCFHGVGHGFYLFMQNNLPKAIEHCRDLGTDAGRDACYGGVFMENLDTDDGSAPDPKTAWISDTDIRYPCTLFADDTNTLNWCYALQSEYMLQKIRDYTIASEQCLESPSAVVGTCFKALGRVRAAKNLSDPKYLQTFCDSVPEEYFDECILGGTKMVIDFPGPDPTGSAVHYCKDLSGDSAKAVCYARYTQTITEMFPVSDTDTRLHICSLFESPYDASCVRVQTQAVH